MELELESKKEGNELTIKLSGEINTGTAPQLKELLNAEIADSDVITLDFEKCDFEVCLPDQFSYGLFIRHRGCPF